MTGQGKSLFAFSLIAFILLSGCVPQQERQNTFNSEWDVKDANEKQLNALEEQRKSYSVNEEVFTALPEPPIDFNKMATLYIQGGFRDETFFSEKYFLQPEFYPSFMENGLQYWVSPPTTHWGAYGYGSFPILRNAEARQGETLKTKFFLHSGYGVRSYQGIGVRIEYQDANSEKFLRSKLSKGAVLLAPNFPRFEREWADAITIETGIDANAPSGEYVVLVWPGNAPDELNSEWQKIAGESGKPYYGTLPVSGSKPLYELRVSVRRD